MKSDQQPNADELALLRQWEVKEPLPPRFNEQVWRRIARLQAQGTQTSWNRFFNWLSLTLARPALATGYLTVLLVLGAAGGYWRAQVENSRVSEHLGARYVELMQSFAENGR